MSDALPLYAGWTLIELRAALMHWGLAASADGPRGGNPCAWMSPGITQRPLYEWTERDSLIDCALAQLQRRGNGLYSHVLTLAYRSELPREAQAKTLHMRYVWYRELVWQGERFLLDIVRTLDTRKAKVLEMC